MDELLVTSMLCRSKVWSRVWTHRCDVIMNPYISVCPLARLSRFPLSLSRLAIGPPPRLSLSCFHLSALHRGGYVTQPARRPRFVPSPALVFLFLHLSPSTACSSRSLLPHLWMPRHSRTSYFFWVTEMYESNCIYCKFVPVNQTSHNWFFPKDSLLEQLGVSSPRGHKTQISEMHYWIVFASWKTFLILFHFASLRQQAACGAMDFFLCIQPQTSFT